LKDKTYTLQLSTNEINFVTTPFTSITILNEDEVIIKLISEFQIKYNSVSIPDRYLELLTELLNKHELIQFKEEFVSIIGFINYTVNLHTPEIIESEKQNDLILEFQNEKEEWIMLLDFIEKFLNQHNKKDILQLKIINVDTSLKLKNFFVIKDAIESLCIGLGINEENYEKRRIEILNDLNGLNFKNLSKFISRKSLSLMFEFLQKNSLTVVDALRFAGLIFRLSNVMIEKENTEIELFPHLDTNLDDINYNNLRNQLSRIPSIKI
jgi:hypothetical protein